MGHRVLVRNRRYRQALTTAALPGPDKQVYRDRPRHLKNYGAGIRRNDMLSRVTVTGPRLLGRQGAINRKRRKSYERFH
jgi:hypothetical protein